MIPYRARFSCSRRSEQEKWNWTIVSFDNIFDGFYLQIVWNFRKFTTRLIIFQKTAEFRFII